MDELRPFVGVWRASRGVPYSSHTFSWTSVGAGLRGSWTIEAADSPGARAAAEAGRPTRFEMSIGEPWLEDGVLLFRIKGGPFISEFRLVGPDEAVVGAAESKLPPEFQGPDLQRSIDGHRVRLTRDSGAAG